MNLLKILLITLTFFATLHAVEIGLNVKAGLNISKCYYSEEPTGWPSFKSKPLFSPTGGVAIPVTLVERFTIQPEILFYQSGWRFENSDSGSAYVDLFSDSTVEYSFDLTGNVTYSFLEIPLAFKCNFLTERKIKPSLYAGPSISFLLAINSHQEGIINGEEVDTSYTESKERYETASLNIILGGELDFELPVGYLITDIRYYFGLKSIDTRFDDLKDKGVRILLGFGYDF